MGDVTFVAKSDRLEEDQAKIARLLLVVEGLAHNAIEQLPPAHLLGDEIIEFLFAEYIIKTDNVLAPQILEDIDFVHKGNFISFRKIGLRNYLDGKRIPRLHMLPGFHYRERSLSQL